MTFNFTDYGPQGVPGDHPARRRARRRTTRFGGDPLQHLAALRDRARQRARLRAVHQLAREPGRHRRLDRRPDLRQLHDPVGAGPGDDPQDRRAAAEADRDLALAGLRDARQAGARSGPEGGHRRLRHRRAVPDHLLPRARRHRDGRAVHLRALLLRDRQADPDHADAAGHRRPDPDARRRGRREHRRLRTRERGGEGRQIGRHGDRHGLPQGPDGDHRREHRHVPRRVHPLHHRDGGRPRLRLHARSRRHRLAVHGGARDAGDPLLAARHAPDPLASGRSAPASRRINFKIDYMGKAKWFFSLSGVHPARLRAGDVRQGHQLRHRLRRRHADHRVAARRRRRSIRCATRSRRWASPTRRSRRCTNPELG